MKSVNAAVVNAIRTGYDVTAIPRLTVEWNLNRYSDVTVDNDPAEDLEGYDIEAFPIESITGPNRPTAGILKARVNEALVADPYSSYTGKTRMARYYLGSVDDIYKYWTSPYPTGADRSFPKAADAVTTVRPHVNYDAGVRTNRIVIGFEDTFAQPDVFRVYVRTVQGSNSYSLVSTSPTINAQGQVILNYDPAAPQKWFTGNTPTNDSTVMPVIYGIQVQVDSMKAMPTGSTTGVGTYCNVIEISARRVHDLTDRLVSVNDTFDMSEKSMIYPIGTITSNTGSVELFNGDGLLNSENPTSPYATLLEPNAMFNLEYIYKINGVDYPVQQFKMYGGPWKGQRADSVSVELSDFSKYFQETKPRPLTFQDVTVAEIVWHVCDSVGFVDYEVQVNDATTQHKIPIWWADGEKTVWEVFDELAQASQTAIYFDAYGKLQVRTREAAFTAAAAPVWTLRGENAGTELADIAELNQADELESNFVKVTYSTTDIDPIVDGQSKNQVLWEPEEETVALRAAPLYNDLTMVSTFISLAPAEAKIWPFEGMVNIEGELIKYKGKNFVYYEGGVRKSVVVNSTEEKETYNNKTSVANRYKNHYTGHLKITERGVWNSEAKSHTVVTNGYWSTRSIINGTRRTGVSGFRQHRSESRVYLNPGARFKDDKDLLIATRGAESDPGFYQYGTKFRFEKSGGKQQRAGIVIMNNGTTEDGYYIDLTPTKKLSAGKKRATRNEITLYTRNGGKWKLQGKGAAFAIAEGVDYELNVFYSTSGNDHVLNVWINGKKAFSRTISGTDKVPFGGKVGMFTRGDTTASFEYIYAIRRPGDDPPDDFSYLHKVLGDYQGDQLNREVIYGFRTVTRRIRKRWLKAVDRYVVNLFDEFGPYVHEVREFNVKFDPKPAISSRLYMGNDWSVICPEYRADSFSARFYVANVSRSTAIAHGEDTLTYAGSKSAINPIMSVIGRSVTVKEAETVEAKNETQIRKRGEIQSELTSEWIQSKEMAQAIADWIKNHWSVGADEQEVTIFGNPLLEIGDVVAIEYPAMNMTAATHKYFVVNASSTFDTGLETTLTLRRIV